MTPFASDGFSPVSLRMNYSIVPSLPRGLDHRALLLAIAFLAVSFPLAWYAYRVLFYASALPGPDVPNHLAIIRHIAEHKSLLFPISQFYPDDLGQGYYPTFMHAIVAAIHLVTGAGIVDVLKCFMFSVVVLGQPVYALLCVRLANGSPGRGLFMYLVLSFNTGMLLHTLRDGIYAELFAIWLLLPMLICCLLQRRTIWAGLLLAAIVASNIPASFGTAMLVLSFLGLYVIEKRRHETKRVLKTILVAAVVASPALYYCYLLMVINAAGGGLETYPQPLLAGYSNVYMALFVGGGLCSLAMMVFYRQRRWLAIWAALYVILILAPFLSGISPRFIRQLSIPLSLCVGMVLYDGAKLLAGRVHSLGLWGRPALKAQLGGIILALFAMAMIGDGVPSMASEADPEYTYYFSPLKHEAYQWMNEQTVGQEEGVITVVLMDPWAKVYLTRRVWEVGAPSLAAKDLSKLDRDINDDIVGALLSDPSPDALVERHISYIILSSPLANRWYQPENEELVDTLLDTLGHKYRKHYDLVYYRHRGSESIRIYRMHVQPA